MNLLILTQKVDKNDPVLGFFHFWLIEFSKKFENIIIICLEKGEFNLPKNVQVLSLGKEDGVSRIKYLKRFFYYIWKYRKEYDSVFVHMNQEYVLLAGVSWKVLGKKVFLWRNHARGNFLTRIAILFSDKVFCTSPKSFTARFKKTRIMPVGVDTNFFSPSNFVQKRPRSILFLGRIAPVKNVDLFIDALIKMKSRGITFEATIAGNSDSFEYAQDIKEKVSRAGLDDNINFLGPVTREDALGLYREHELYVNLTPSGSLDKTIFEALSVGSKVLVVNDFFKDKLPKDWIASHDLAESLDKVLKYDSDFDTSFVEDYSLSKTIDSLFKEFK